MRNCDYVLWQANPNSPSVSDLYSAGYGTPYADSNQNYVSSYTMNSTYVTFTSDRKLNTGDSGDYVIPLVSYF
jgi:hypothetical protein